MRVLLAALLTALALPALAETPASALKLTLGGLKSADGQVVVALFDSEAAYKAMKTPVRTAKTPALVAGVEVAWSDLPPGRYAAVMYHDRNGNGELDRMPIGLPKEPYAFSNNAPVRFGPPPWKAAAFEVRAGGNAQSATLR